MMENNNDIGLADQLHYSCLFLFIMQLWIILATAIPLLSPSLPVANLIFDSILILFAYFIVKLKKQYDINNAHLAALMIVSATVVDFTVTILWYMFANSWQNYPLLMIRLAHIIIYLIGMTGGFILVTDISKQLIEIRKRERHARYYLSIGYLTLAFPYLYGWYKDYTKEILLNPANNPFLENLSFFAIMIATVFICIGFLDQSFFYKEIFAKKKVIDEESEVPLQEMATTIEENFEDNANALEEPQNALEHATDADEPEE